MNNQTILPDPELLARIILDPQVRREVTYTSHLLFFYVYMAHQVTYKTADFHKELFALTHDTEHVLKVIIGFRGSGKTTILSESYPIWAILGAPQKKFVLIVCKTAEQARQKLKNIKLALETNELLRADLGPFKEDPDEWNANSLVLDKYEAKITAVSSEQSIRGAKFRGVRPDLVIMDDIEDQESVRSLEAREKLYDWISGEIMPIGDKGTAFIMLGNALHPESLLLRWAKRIQNGEIQGLFKKYPIVTNKGEILWPGKYPTLKDIEKERTLIGDERTWQREYLLNPIPKIEQIIKEDWLQYYEHLPSIKNGNCIGTFIGVDPAISKREHADYTAMVSAHVFVIKEEVYAYISPNPINARLDNPELLSTVKHLSDSMESGWAKILVEKAGYQEAIAQQLQEDGYHTEAVAIGGIQKSDRLRMASTHIQRGRILFPLRDNTLTKALLNFGVSKHDDLVDAFSLLANYVCSEKNIMRRMPEVVLLW